MGKKQQKCTVCNGTGLAPIEVDKFNAEQTTILKDIRCTHCGGSGDEPAKAKAVDTSSAS